MGVGYLLSLTSAGQVLAGVLFFLGFIRAGPAEMLTSEGGETVSVWLTFMSTDFLGLI